MKIRVHYNSPVVLTFAIICAIVFILNYITNQAFIGLFSLSSSFVFSNIISYLTLFTYIFGHANMEHLLGNMMFILLLGPVLEEKYKTQNMIIMILATALITAILNLMFFSTGILGASGIVFLFIILVSFANVQKGTIPVTFILILLLYVGKEIIDGFRNDNVSQFAHILGGLCGSIFGFLAINKPAAINN